MKWYFPVDEGGEEAGLNDAGIEFFRSGSGSLARETVQNCGDARDPASTNPVLVTFTRILVPRSEFPGADELRATVDAARSYAMGACRTDEERKANGEAFFESALRLLSSDDIPFLRISDFNTTGLEGNEAELMSPWYRLIRRQGTTSMHGAGGGTFGIGQRAPFAFSALRTVFYGTRTRAGDSSLIGKSILCTFADAEDRRRRAVGFWGQERSGRSDVTAIRSDALIPSQFRRELTGTDLFIAGFVLEDWGEDVARSVVQNFFAAIHAGQLKVEIRDGDHPTLLIDSSTLRAVINDIHSRAAVSQRSAAERREILAELESTRFYVEAMDLPWGGVPRTRNSKRLGEMRLYVTLDPAAPNRTAFMRKPRILVYDRAQRAALQGYAAVFMAEDESGNHALARMEDPSHTKWDRSRVKGGGAILDEIYGFVREELRVIAGTTQSEAHDVPELGQYLPEDDSDVTGDQMRGLRTTDRHTADETARKQQKLVVIRKPKRAPKRERPPRPSDAPGAGGGAESRGEGGGPGGGPGEGGEGGGGGVRPGTGPGGLGGDESAPRQLTPTEIGFRSFYSDGQLQLVLWAERSGVADIVVRAAGEAGNYPIRIRSADDARTGASLPFDGSTIPRLSLVVGTRRHLRLAVDAPIQVALALEIR